MSGTIGNSNKFNKQKFHVIAELLQLKVFLICIVFGKNEFFLASRCPISIYAKVETLILPFSNLLGNTLPLNVFQTHSIMKMDLKQQLINDQNLTFY